MEWGRWGIAPFWVQTNAEVCTAVAWASVKLLPLSRDATKAAVKLSPAPTVSATETFGVGINELLLPVNT